jgi:hypothetical protein
MRSPPANTATLNLGDAPTEAQHAKHKTQNAKHKTLPKPKSSKSFHFLACEESLRGLHDGRQKRERENLTQSCAPSAPPFCAKSVDWTIRLTHDTIITCVNTSKGESPAPSVISLPEFGLMERMPAHTNERSTKQQRQSSTNEEDMFKHAGKTARSEISHNLETPTHTENDSALSDWKSARATAACVGL